MVARWAVTGFACGYVGAGCLDGQRLGCDLSNRCRTAGGSLGGAIRGHRTQ